MLLENVHRFARKDLVLPHPGRNTLFQAFNLAGRYLSSKLLRQSTTALSYRRGIFLSHPEPIVGYVTILLDAIPLKMSQSNNELGSSVPIFGCLNVGVHRVA